MNNTALSPKAISDQLCPSCGLCCNGVIFRDVKLQPGDDVVKLRALGLPISGRGCGRLPQPCAALEGCRCRVYASRPLYCRQFECGLFKNVLGGEVKPAQALRLVRTARRLAGKVQRLLRSLGDADEQSPLKERFQRIADICARASPNKRRAERFGRLTLAMHELNMFLGEWFYPGQRKHGVAKSSSGRIAGRARKR